MTLVPTVLNLAVVGDIHGCWEDEDHSLLEKLAPDAVLFVGDLGEADLKVVRSIKRLSVPTALVLGNHDRGSDKSGNLLKTQLDLLGDFHCGWAYRNWTYPPIAVVGARPCSPGGGFHLSKAVESVFGPVTCQQSADLIVNAAEEANESWPLIILAHSGPTGLGSEANSPCGRDWKSPAIDWGDKDLEIAIDKIRKIRFPELVVFGHMHHKLKRGNGSRSTIYEDCWGTVYLNSACVPRRGRSISDQSLCHFSWIVFEDSHLKSVSHRWFLPDASIAYKENLISR